MAIPRRFVRVNRSQTLLALNLLLLVSVILPAQLSRAAEPSPTPDLVFLLIGQSNMAGRASLADSDSKALPNVMLLDNRNRWIPATNPLNRFASDRKKLSMQRVGPGDGFARRLSQALPAKQIGLVVNARGGSSINEWAKGKPLYDNTIKRVQAIPNIPLAGIIWHQGESDREDPRYHDKLAKLIKNLRADVAKPKVPFIAGEIYGKGHVNDVFRRLPAKIPHTGFASSENLAVFDKVHFDRKSQQILGARYADVYLRLSGHKPR